VLVLAIALPPSAARAGGGGYYEFHRWILSDALGSGVVVLDEAGMLMRHTRFRPFGGVDDERAPGDRSGRRIWAGHPEQEETGLVQMQARWMDPETGTFLSVDPVVPDARDPQALNAYAYAANNPVSLADPSGMSPPVPGPPGGLNAFYAEPGQAFAGGGGMLQSASEVHAYQHWGEAESEPGSDLVPLAGAEQGGGSWLRGLGELLDLVWEGVRAVVKLIANDVVGAVFGFGYGNLLGLLGGFGTALGGLLTGDVSQLRSGIRSMGWALVPRFGFNSGPGHGHPELEPRTVIDEATLEHDTAYARLNEEERVGILSRRTTTADARLIRSVWRSPLQLGPVGQVYRAGLTVSFAFKIGAQEALGATGVIE
jgi:RHS repeat-associated protein